MAFLGHSVDKGHALAFVASACGVGLKTADTLSAVYPCNNLYHTHVSLQQAVSLLAFRLP